MPEYPWYEAVSGPNLEQGDIIPACPVFTVPAGAIDDPIQYPVRVQRRTAVVLTQSCDLVSRQGRRPAAEFVLLCPLHSRAALAADPAFSKASAWEEARKGRIPSSHVLNRSEVPGLESDHLFVDFRRAFSLNFDLVEAAALSAGPRLRLLPPYREHLAQGFARFFMRVGLPVDITPFK